MSRRLDDTDLQKLLDAAYADRAHAVDVVRLVEEVKWYREGLRAATSTFITTRPDRGAGAKPVGEKFVSRRDVVKALFDSVPGMATGADPDPNLRTLFRDPVFHTYLSLYEMNRLSLPEMLAAVVVAMSRSKTILYAELVRVQNIPVSSIGLRAVSDTWGAKRGTVPVKIESLWTEGTDPDPDPEIRATLVEAARQIEKDSRAAMDRYPLPSLQGSGCSDSLVVGPDDCKGPLLTGDDPKLDVNYDDTQPTIIETK